MVCYLAGKNGVYKYYLDEHQNPLFSGGHQIAYLLKLSFQKNKIPLSLSQASTPYHRNVFTLLSPLSEGRASKAWGHSNNIMVFLPPEI
jgi:hypothetical protein